MPIAVSTAPASVIFGWDASHYDGQLTLADMKRAVAEGIAFFTHKLGEGLGAEDATQGTALAAARDAGILVLGGYWFLHGNLDPTAEARACVAMADRDEPWWRTFPGWVWQADAETSKTGLPSPGHLKAFADALERISGRKVLCYASHGMYGNTLAGLGHPLWNASYGQNKQGPFKALYPGDNSAGWMPYSGQTPAILQYGSGATIAGHTTCDINAYRGSIADLLTLIGATPIITVEEDMPLTPVDAELVAKAILAEVIDQPGVKSTVGNLLAVTYLNTASAKLALAGLTPDALGAAVIKALPGSTAAGLTAAQVGAAVHEVLVSDMQAAATAVAAQK